MIILTENSTIRPPLESKNNQCVDADFSILCFTRLLIRGWNTPKNFVASVWVRIRRQVQNTNFSILIPIYNRYSGTLHNSISRPEPRPSCFATICARPCACYADTPATLRSTLLACRSESPLRFCFCYSSSPHGRPRSRAPWRRSDPCGPGRASRPPFACRAGPRCGRPPLRPARAAEA